MIWNFDTDILCIQKIFKSFESIEVLYWIEGLIYVHDYFLEKEPN